MSRRSGRPFPGPPPSSPDLHARCNPLIVGGDLAGPSPEERRELDRVAAAAADLPSADGLVLAGHRPNAVVSRWLAAARVGQPGLVAPGGISVSGSVKEEFGLAILEALAAGLPVVAQGAGGPATYIDDGVTGALADGTPAAAWELGAAPRARPGRDTARVRVQFGSTADRLWRVRAGAGATESLVGLVLRQ